MAGDWIKMRGNLWDDPRVTRLCDLTDAGEAQIVGALYWLWATADQHTEDGLLPGLTLRQIDRKTGVPGFAKALCDIGWMEDTPDGVRILRFEEHNGTSAKRRCTDAQRKANIRNVSALQADIAQTEEGRKTPSLGAREEKRREEKDLAPNGACPPASAEVKPLKTAKPELPDCPHDAVQALYHDVLPMLPRVEVWNKTRQALLRQRWREVCADQRYTTESEGLGWFRDYFELVKTSRFLTGRAQPKPGSPPFLADLEWLVRPTNFVKVVEGRYNREAA
jgi:hypothetical protein